MLPQVFTRAEALADGNDEKQIDARVRSGEWTALRRSVYVVTAQLPADPGPRHAVDVAAAARATAQDVVGSHESAALVHGLTTFVAYAGPPVLSRCREPRHDRPHGALPAPLVSHIPPQHRTEVHGAPVTTIARTAVDLARKGPALSAVVVLDSALRRKVPRDELEEVLRIGKGWPGSKRAADYVAFADGRAESAPGVGGALAHVAVRLPEARTPDPALRRRRAHGIPGLLWEDLKVIGEADGLLKYRREGEEPDPRERDALALEKLREDRFRDDGYEVFRFTWDIAVRRPAVLEQRGLRAFSRAAEKHRRAA